MCSIKLFPSQPAWIYVCNDRKMSCYTLLVIVSEWVSWVQGLFGYLQTDGEKNHTLHTIFLLYFTADVTYFALPCSPFHHRNFLSFSFSTLTLSHLSFLTLSTNEDSFQLESLFYLEKAAMTAAKKNWEDFKLNSRRIKITSISFLKCHKH